MKSLKHYMDMAKEKNRKKGAKPPEESTTRSGTGYRKWGQSPNNSSKDDSPNQNHRGRKRTRRRRRKRKKQKGGFQYGQKLASLIKTRPLRSSKSKASKTKNKSRKKKGKKKTRNRRYKKK